MTAVGSGGTITNTDHSGGVIHLFDVSAGHSVQWLICLLHMNELPFRHIFTALDSVTKSPSAYSGTIGKQLGTAHTLSIVKFKALPFNAPDVELHDLSHDQKYLLRINIAIGSGE